MLALGEGLDDLPGATEVEPVFGLPGKWIPAELRQSGRQPDIIPAAFPAPFRKQIVPSFLRAAALAVELEALPAEVQQDSISISWIVTSGSPVTSVKINEDAKTIRQTEAGKPLIFSHILPLVDGPNQVTITATDRSGATVTFGSDWPVAPLDPIQGVHAAVTRQTIDGAHPGGWLPEQKVTVEQALVAYTTANAYNPNDSGCQAELDNGLTGTSGAWEQGEPVVTAARTPNFNDYSHGAPFVPDSYDISELAGEAGAVVRFSYYTDGAFDRPGWFIDDVVVTVDGTPIYNSDFEDSAEPDRLFPGGCSADGFKVAATCTDGWLTTNRRP